MTIISPSSSAAPDLDQVVRLDPWWVDGAMSAIETLAATGVIFSTDDLRRDPFSIPEPCHSAHWGALFARARTLGVISPVGYIASTTPSRNGGVLRTWRGGGPGVAA